MLKRTLFTALVASATFAFAASAQAAYLSLGTGNASNATTTLAGNTAGAELLVKNANGSSAGAFSLYGLLTATAPTVNAAAVRGYNSATNAFGYGVWGSQAGSGTGVYGSSPSGKGVWGTTTSGTGVRGSSSSGTGVLGQHLATTGTAPGVSASTNSTADDADALVATVTPTSPGVNSEAVRGVNNGTGFAGIGVYGQQNGSGYGVYGSTSNGTGVTGTSLSFGTGVYGTTPNGTGVFGDSSSGDGVVGGSSSGDGVHGSSSSGFGVGGNSQNDDGVHGYSSNGTGVHGSSGTGYAGWFQGNVTVTGTLTKGGGAFRIDHPLHPAHTYLQHSFVESPDMMDVYNGNVRTDAKGFATVAMPRYFQALNRSFRYQLTPLGRDGWNARAGIWRKIRNSRFTIRTDKPRVEVSWQVTGIRHDRYANAHRIKVVLPKARAEQGKYLHPQLYGKPKSEGIGYVKPPKLQRPASSPAKLPRKR